MMSLNLQHTLALTWTGLDTWIVVIGGLAAMACALVGVFLVLRQMSMMGDAISHAVLPGLAGGFLTVLLLQDSTWLNELLATYWPSLGQWITQADPRHPMVMLVGASIIGVLTALFTQWIHRFGHVDQGAAMGVVFTTLFAIGLLLIVLATEDHRVDLDASCVLYGSVEQAPLDTMTVLGFELPRAVVVIGGVLLINSLIVLLFFKELRVSSFDQQLATTLGIPAHFMHYLLMTMVAITTVACFEAIGSILVIAMLIVPAAAAHLLTDRLLPMLLVAMGLGALSALLGHLAAITVPTWFTLQEIRLQSVSSSGSIAVVAGLILLVAMCLSPQHGFVFLILSRWQLTVRVAREDCLAMLYRLEELHVQDQTKLTQQHIQQALHAPRLLTGWAIKQLVQKNLIVRHTHHLQLTQQGRQKASRLVRAHRLWETYLAQHLDMPLAKVHAPAEKLEHVSDDHMIQRLADATGYPTTDPHGRPLPPNTVASTATTQPIDTHDHNTP